MNMDFNKMIPELSVFDIEQTKRFYNDLGFKIEYERPEEKFVFMSFQDSQFMFEQIHDDGWNTGELIYPLGRGINFSISVDDIEIDTFAKVTDYLLDNFISDFYVQSKINNASQQVDDAIYETEKILNVLKNAQ